MRRTIQIGDKYKPLMDYYSEKFDKEEFNVFITKLLIAYKKMKDKNIDLITFAELIEPYDIDIIDLIKLITENAELKTAPNADSIMITKTSSFDKQEVPEVQNSKVINIENKNRKSISDENKEEQHNSANAVADNPILRLGIDLSQ
jgi:hypothetical protein